MASAIKRLFDSGLLSGPSFCKETHYEVVMGSVSYGVSNDMSDQDIYAFCIPRRDIVFPESAGFIHGFDDSQADRFEQMQKHHIAFDGRLYDVQIHNIVKYFRLAAEGNPNMIDSLFVPNRCVLHMKPAGQILRDNRKLFLSKIVWHKFKGYAYSQLNKARVKPFWQLLEMAKRNFGVDPETFGFPEEGAIERFVGYVKKTVVDSALSQGHKDAYAAILARLADFNFSGGRATSIVEYGWDVKFGYHTVRLIAEVEQILAEGDLDLERNADQLRAIRRGSMTLEQVEEWFGEKERQLGEIYHRSELPHKPRWPEIKAILLQCLEESYGAERVPRAKTDMSALAESVREHILGWGQ